MKEEHMRSLNRWRILIQEQRNSGLKVIEWCRNNGYTKSSYYYWSRMLQQEDMSSVSAPLQNAAHCEGFVEVTPMLAHAPAVKPTNVHTSVALPDAILCGENIEIKLFNSASVELIRCLIEEVKHA